MLRTYKPITHPIFTLHSWLEHLVSEVWCNANAVQSCVELLSAELEIVYIDCEWLRLSVDDIYEKCKVLTAKQRADIREAFSINNRIEELCNGVFMPIELGALPKVVEDDMKPLLKKFYFDLLKRADVPGDKLDYYNKLIARNDFKTCPCCGLSLIETAETHYREDHDHYLPVADYPFATVNFKNLIPICGKCNKKCKGTKNPFANGRMSFFAFEGARPDLLVITSILDQDDLDYRKLRKKDLAISFNGDANKVDTWNWLFKTSDRYIIETKGFSKTELRTVANRLFRNNRRKLGLSYEEILDDTIEDYDIDTYEDRKFLKTAFLKAVKNRPEWMAVYQP